MKRRELLAGLGGLAGAASLRRAFADGAHARDAHASTAVDRKLLFVFCATGGASIQDSFLPLSRSEAVDDVTADVLNVYEDAQVIRPEGSNIACPAYVASDGLLSGVYEPGYLIEEFLRRHYDSMTVLTERCSSVNHFVGQQRSITGGGINRGQTLMEAVAVRHGSGLVLPNCNMATGGFVQPGADPSVPDFARAEVIAAPLGFASALDGVRGVVGAPSRSAVDRARRVRERLDDISAFTTRFADAEPRRGYLRNRRELLPRLEQAELTERLNLIPPELLDPSFGLDSSPLLPLLLEHFPELSIDPWQAQASLALLLAYFGLSCSNTVGLRVEPTFSGGKLETTPIAFDFAHFDHRVAQSLMWGELLSALDGFVTLLKQLDYLGDPALGKMWDRSVIYVATEFGREMRREAGATNWSSGHALDNGVLLMSPMFQGNRIFGSLDPATARTVGFDPQSGDDDPQSSITEAHIYSALCQALDVDFPERLDMSAILAM